MPTLTDIRSRVDNWLAARWPVVQQRQNNYFSAHQKYWQGLKTATVEPKHTTAMFADDKQDKLAIKPTDQVESWLDFLAEIDDLAIPAALICDVYDGPLGYGYVATVIARYNGVIYSRSQNVGKETWRTLDWRVVDAVTKIGP